MTTEVQITNRNTIVPRRLTATLTDIDTGDTVLGFVLGPGEAVIIPLLTTMNVVVSLPPAEDEPEVPDGTAESAAPPPARLAN